VNRKSLITLILGIVLAVAPAARASVMADSGGSAVTPVVVHTDVLGGDGSPAVTGAAYTADTIRGAALNEQYGNAVTRLSPAQFASLYTAGADQLAPQEFAAQVARGEQLNRQYGNGGQGIQPVRIQTDILGGDGGVSTQVRTSSPGDPFPWTTAIGTTVLGAMLLAMATLALTRRRHSLGF